VSGVRSTVDPAALRFDAAGLLPVVVQEVASGAVLMVAWADRGAVERTLDSGEGWFWSRSRRQPWRKGATSGYTLSVVEVRADCDGDTLLYRVDAAGPACHRGTRTCFDGEGNVNVNVNVNGERSARGKEAGGNAVRPVSTKEDGSDAGASPPPAAWGPRLELGWLWDVLEARREEGGEESYTARLLAAGVDRIGRKVGEEATETVIAALRAVEGPDEARQALTGEAADLLYHLLVLLMAAGSTPEDVAAALRRRHAGPRRQAAAKPEGPPLAESVEVRAADAGVAPAEARGREATGAEGSRRTAPNGETS
jgi:phosphoribosyl-AMP cyclohydrolase / phosphoribosyl-ATP pyrophosphohydrolase